MARDFAKSFYRSKQWETVRNSYMRDGQGLCEPCLRQGRYTKARIVHHKIHLSPQNIDDPRITLDPANLERVCYDCHAREHPEVYGWDRRSPRVAFDEDGNVVPI